MVIYLSKLIKPIAGLKTLLALCGNCEAVFKWENPFWHLKKIFPRYERCSVCNGMNHFVKRLKTTSRQEYKPVWSRSHKT